MKGIDAVRMALKMADRWVRLIEEMKDAPLTRTRPDRTHCMWVLGHITVTEGRLHKVLLGVPNPVEHWKPMFDAGSTPSDDPAAYPPFAEVLQTYRQLRARTMEELEKIGDEGLDRPVENPPPGLEAGLCHCGGRPCC